MGQPARSYTVTEVQNSSRAAIQRARDGEVVDITVHGKVVARIVPAGGLLFEHEIPEGPTLVEPAIRWGVPGAPIGLNPPEPVVGGVQDLIREGRR